VYASFLTPFVFPLARGLYGAEKRFGIFSEDLAGTLFRNRRRFQKPV
jgi:hypothetical protein